MSEHMQIVGLAGCGTMGAPMLAALRRAGIPARGYDIVDDRGDPGDLQDFSEGLTTLISVVRDAEQTDNLLFDAQALVRCPDLETIIISSTLSPRYVLGLRERVPAHIRLVDAPMSGAQVRAKAGTLTFMIGGEAEAFSPLFQAMGKDIHLMGAFGAGMTAKVLNNFLAASHTVMTRLVLDWADTIGMDERKLLDLIHSASGQNWLASGFDEIEFARAGFAPDNSIGILVKDVAAGLDMAPEGADIGLPTLIQSALANLKERRPS